MYKLVFAGLQVPKTFKLLWKDKCMPRIKFFVWLLIMDWMNTKDMLQRRNNNVQSGTHYVLCQGAIRETREHLFFDCVFAKHFWSLISILWYDVLNIHDKILAAWQTSGLPFFMDIFLIASWEIWKLRNAIIFYGERCSHQIWIRRLKEHILLKFVHFTEDKRVLFIQWLETIL